MNKDARRDRNSAAVLAAKSVPCTDCLLPFPPAQMWLYHARGVRRFAMSQAHGHSCGTVLAEIAKCDPVCEGCGAVRISRDNTRRAAQSKPVRIRSAVPLERRELSLTQMLRRESQKHDARERRRIARLDPPGHT